jgi:hypothetical protein
MAKPRAHGGKKALQRPFAIDDVHTSENDDSFTAVRSVQPGVNEVLDVSWAYRKLEPAETGGSYTVSRNPILDTAGG